MTRSLLLTALGVAAAAMLVPIVLTAQSPNTPTGPATDAEIRKLVEQLDRGREAWINGQLEASAGSYMVQAPDMFIFPPFGGLPPTQGAAGPDLREMQKRTVAQFKGGTGKTELIKSMASGDMLVLVLLETNQVKFDGHAEPKPWSLRTTQVFRRDGDHWLRLHRHADTLIKQRSLDETFALY
jgi:ketosteroid isomerase-like protein